MRKENFRVGTSGYSYPWNKGKPTPFQWYLAQGFNTVEINASFYRFPSMNWLEMWKKYCPDDFDFSIKVNRSITHYVRLKGEKALDLWRRFSSILLKDKILEPKISFFLFQLPSDFAPSEENIGTLRSFFEEADLGNRAAIEFRDSAW